jgi:hypothetical protein
MRPDCQRIARETNMRVSKIAAVGTAAAAILSSGIGLAAANASTAAPAKSGTEHLSLMSTQPSGARAVIIASGVFTAGGVDITGNTTDKVVLPGGTFKIVHKGNPHVVKQSFNPQTCLSDFVGTAPFTITKGTGKYKGISGSGHARITYYFIAKRSKGKCNPNANPAVVEQTIIATGHVKL